ncbi:hypothetical protein FNW25_15755 [Flavobacterium franklandianum]|uniref:hypothetical protein n=1 Tax=Flavobacterium franklandianum TaxID=2594430 RepID=UPI00117AF0D7|nr:hypothetical protein [Flavobacterium franklandianum]TRX21516.1 hypothetical protein FNW25_15755 [Flavobacterium franklandianum]
MKNLIIYTGIALVVLTNSSITLFDKNCGVEFSQDSKKGVVTSKVFKTIFSDENVISQTKETTTKESIKLKSKTLFLRNFSKTTESKTIGGEEPIEGVSVNKINKTANELIAEDNLITENNISNETQVLDFNIINSASLDLEIVEFVNTSKTEITADQLIAEDNAITENNISNVTQALDFMVINSISEGFKVVEFVNTSKTEITAEQLIAEDNAITENNISNDTQALDFEIIYKISKPRKQLKF